MKKFVHFLDIPVRLEGLEGAMSDFEDERGCQVLIFASAQLISIAQKKDSIRYFLQENGVYPDSFYLTKYLRTFNPLVKQIRGIDFLNRVMNNSNQNLRHLFIGERFAIEHAASKAKSENQNLKIVGTIPAPFKDEFTNEIFEWATIIKATEANVIWLGLGTPKQHEIAMKLKDEVASRIVCVGAAMSFYSGDLEKCPEWITAIGGEWLFRLSREPQRLFRRYLTTNIHFIALSLMDYYSRKTRNKVKRETHSESFGNRE